MKGTEKQIKWAEDILRTAKENAAETRQTYVDKKNAYLAKRAAKGLEGMKESRRIYYDNIFAGLDRMDHYLETIDDAKEIIENRDDILWFSGFRFSPDAWK